MLGDTASVVARLGRDPGASVVGAVLEAASTRILRRTRYVLEDTTGITQVERKLQLGKVFLLDKRPVSLIQSITGRLPSQTDTTPLAWDLFDPVAGKLELVVTDFTPIFPPHYTAKQPIFDWRAPIWPYVNITFNASAIPADAKARLDTAAVELATHWLSQNPGVTMQTVGLLSTQWSDDPKAAPPWLEGMLAADIVDEMGSKWIS